MSGKELIFRLIKKMKDHKIIPIVIAVILIVLVVNAILYNIEMQKKEETTNKVINHLSGLGYNCIIEDNENNDIVRISITDPNGKNISCKVGDIPPNWVNEYWHMEDKTINGIAVKKYSNDIGSASFCFVPTSNGLWVEFIDNHGEIEDENIGNLVVNY